MKTFIHLANRLLLSGILGSIRRHGKDVPGDEHVFTFPDFRCFDMDETCLKGLHEHAESFDFMDQQGKFDLGGDFYLERDLEHSNT